jgi:poly(A) polymerase
MYLADAPTMRLSRLKTILIHPAIVNCWSYTGPTRSRLARAWRHVEFCERMLRETAAGGVEPAAGGHGKT